MNWFTRHGFGISSTTTSVLPVIEQRTKTPKAKNETLTGPQNDHPKYPAPRKSLLNKLGIGKGDKIAPLENNEGSAAIKPQLVSKDKAKFTHSLDHDLLLKDSKYFGKLDESQRKILNGALKQVIDRLPPRPDLPSELRNGDKSVLTQVLAEVSKAVPNGIEDVVRGLACLQNIDMLDSIRNPDRATPHNLNSDPQVVPCPAHAGRGLGPDRHRGNGYDHADVDCAWRIAQTLAETPTGFQLLKKITVAQPLPPDLHITVTRHHDEMLHVFLKGAKVMAEKAKKKRRPQINDPKALYEHIKGKLDIGRLTLEQRENPGRNGTATPAKEELTVLDKGILALRDHLRQSAEHIENTPTAKFEIPEDKQNGNAWAIGMIRNEMYDDKKRDEKGKPTRFALIEGRTEKIARVTEAVYSRPDTQLKRLKKAIKRAVAPYKDKSALRAYNNLGKGKDAIGFMQSEKIGGIFEGRTVKENLMANVMKGLRTRGGGEDWEHAALLPIRSLPNGVTNMPNERVLRNLVRLAILEESNTTALLPRYKDGDRLNDFELNRAKQRVYGHLGGNVANRGNLDDQTLDALDRLLRTENVGYTPETLVTWAGDVGGPATTESAVERGQEQAAAVEDGQPDWVRFGQGIDSVVNSAVQTEATPNLAKDDSMTPGQRVKSVARRFRQAIAGQELGSRFSFSSGGIVGGSTAGLTENVTDAITLGTLHGKLDLTYNRARTSVFEAGTGTSGNEIVIATERLNRKKLGAGGGLGLGIPFTPLNVRLAGDFGGAHDGVDRRGSVLRLDRTETGGVMGDAANNAKLGEVAEMVLDPSATGPSAAGPSDADPSAAAPQRTYLQPGNETDRDSIIKRLLQEHPRLSVGWMGTDDSKWNEAVTGSASPGMGIGRFRVNLFTKGGGIQGSQAQQKWQEQGGWLRVEKNTEMVSVQASVATIGPNVGAAITPTTQIPGTEATRNTGLGGLALGSASVDFYKYSYAQRDTLIRKDGELLKQTFRTKTFANVADLRKFVEAKDENSSDPGLTRLDLMAIDKAKKFEAKKFHADPKLGQASIVNGFDEAEMQLEERKSTLEDERKKLAQYLERQEGNVKPNQVFQVYYDLKDSVVAAVNIFDSIKRNALKAGDGKLANDCEQRVQRMLKDEKSWEYAFLVDIDSTSEAHLKGVNFVGRVQQVDSATFSRIRDYT